MAEFPGAPEVGTVVVEENSDGERIELHDVFLDIAERWRSLLRRNAGAQSLSKYYISGEARFAAKRRPYDEANA